MDDDWMGPHNVGHRMQALARNPTALAAYGPYATAGPGETPVLAQPEESEVPLDASGALQAVLRRDWFIGSTLYRGEAIKRYWSDAEGDDLVLDFSLNLSLVRCAVGSNSVVAVRVPQVDFVVTQHEGQNSVRLRTEVMRQTAAVLERFRTAGDPSWNAAISRELANWCVIWGRDIAANGDIRGARRKFLQGAGCCPGLGWAWRQLAASFLCPGRCRASPGT
jgi:hypothetical protein